MRDYCQHMLKFIIPLFLFVLSLAPLTNAQHEVPTSWKYKKLRTPHFDILYNAEQQDLSLLYAEKLEKAHELLGHFFSVLPDRTLVIINDKTDLTNGYATRIPYPHIMAFPVLPGPSESLADTGDWAFDLLAHEYTHILTFEPATGFMKVIRGVFGNIGSANLLLPNWWKEGIAVQMETRLSNHGRLRSVYQDAVIRSFVTNKNLYSIEYPDINEFLPTWPEGLRPYLFGSVVWSEMVANKGDKITDTLNVAHSGRVPYAIDEPARTYLGRTYDIQFNRAMRETELRANEQLKILNQIPPSSFSSMTVDHMYSSAPAISPDGNYLALITVSENDKRQIRIIKRSPYSDKFTDGKELKISDSLQESFSTPTIFDGPPSGSIQRIQWLNNSTQFIYDKVDLVNKIETYSDLYLYDIKTQKTKRLSTSLRAREPSLSLDNQKIIFVKLSGSKTKLATIDINGDPNSLQILFAGDIQERISNPTYISANEIIFSLRKPDGSEFLHKLNLSQSPATLEKILPDYPNARFANIVANKNGSRLFFTSSKNGTHNIYVTDLSFSKVQPVTHTETALFSFAVDAKSNDIYATHIGKGGGEVICLDDVQAHPLPNELPAIKPLFADRYPEQKSTLTNQKDFSAKYEITDYSAGEYLWPQYWIPFLASSSSDSGIVLQAMTSGYDPLKYHMYSLMGSWDTGLGQGSLQGLYLNQQTSLPIQLVAAQKNSYYGTVTNKYTDNAYSLSVLPDTFALSRYSALQLGWKYSERLMTGSEIKRTGPFAFFNYADYVRAGQQISPESGFGGYLGASHYLQKDGYISHTQYMAGATVYFSRFLPKQHAIMLKVNGIHTPEKVTSLYGEQTDGIASYPDSKLPTYVLRGYKTGQLLGRNLATANFEYRFPLRDIYHGSGTDPIYMHRLTGALVSDIGAADGLFVNDKKGVYETAKMGYQYLSYGAEVKLETTLGFVFPISFVLGYYYAPNAPGGGASSIATNLLIGGL